MATHSSILAWRIPGMGEPDGLLSMGSQRVRHDWSDLAAAAAAMQFNIFLCSIGHLHTYTFEICLIRTFAHLEMGYWFLVLSWILDSDQTYDLHIFLPFCELSFHFLDGVFWSTTVLTFKEGYHFIPSFISFFPFVFFMSDLRNLSQPIGRKDLLLCFIVWIFQFQFLDLRYEPFQVNFFCTSWGRVPNTCFYIWILTSPSTISWKDSFISIVSLASQFYFFDRYDYPYDYHTGLTTVTLCWV